MSQIRTGAVDIGGTKILVGIVDEQGTVLQEEAFPTDTKAQSGQEAMDYILLMLKEQCRKEKIVLSSLRGIGISCCGPVNTKEGTLNNPYTLPGWVGFPIVAYMEKASGLAVRLENDANGALLGEVLKRDLVQRKVLMVTIGTGIGVAFWGDGKLYRSGTYHPEMGHVIVSGEDRPCYCGHKGCFESCCSGRAFNERAVEAGYGDFDELYQRAGEQEEKAKALLQRISADMTRGIWSLNLIFKPDTIILAGGFARNYIDYFKKIIMEDSEDKEDFLNQFVVLPACENQNTALAGANMLF